MRRRNHEPEERARPERTHDIVVVGAGISGPVMALHLAHAGFKTHLLERCGPILAAPGPASSSFNITLCERGLAALESVVPRSAVLPLCVPAEQRIIHSADRQRSSQRYGAFGERLYCVSRSDLRRLLVAWAEDHPMIDVEYDQEVVAFDSEAGILEVRDRTCEARRVLAPRHLFAADGARSAVRHSMLSARRFNYSQEYATHGHLELNIAAQHVPHAWRSEVGLHIWPRGRHMFLAFPNVDGSYTGTLHLPLDGERSFTSFKADGRIRQHFAEQYPDLLEAIPDLNAQFDKRNAIAMIMVKCAPWHIRDEVILVGDAAHSVWPSYGQGANASFESCEMLASALMRVPRREWGAAMAQFASNRRRDTDVLTDLCVDHWEELRDRVGDEEFQLKKKLERELAARTGGQYRSLYELISFSRIPYALARERASNQERALVRLLSLPKSRELLHSGAISELLAQGIASGIHEPWMRGTT